MSAMLRAEIFVETDCTDLTVMGAEFSQSWRMPRSKRMCWAPWEIRKQKTGTSIRSRPLVCGRQKISATISRVALRLGCQLAVGPFTARSA